MTVSANVRGRDKRLHIRGYHHAVTPTSLHQNRWRYTTGASALLEGLVKRDPLMAKRTQDVRDSRRPISDPNLRPEGPSGTMVRVS